MKEPKIEKSENVFVGTPLDSLLKDTATIIYLPKDTSRYKGNWVDINQ